MGLRAMSSISMQPRGQCIACRRLTARDGAGISCAACGLSLERDESGLLVPSRSAIADAQREISYPQDGADAMLTVEETSFWFRHRNEVIAVVLERFAPVESVVWDVGGGNGFQANKLQQSGRTVVLLEPGRRACLNALARGVQNVVCGTMSSLHVRDGVLDAACLFDVIEHIEDAVDLLSECRRALRSNGSVIVTVPAYQALWSDEDEYAGHYRRYTVGLLDKQLAAAGLRLEFASYFFQPLVLPIFVLRALPHRLSFKNSKSGAADLSEHGSGGRSQRIVEALLAREARALRAGRTLGFGSSIIAVARRA
jgi:SAM-dependent methyltransferase